jgi:hypothetical protein
MNHQGLSTPNDTHYPYTINGMIFPKTNNNNTSVLESLWCVLGAFAQVYENNPKCQKYVSAFPKYFGIIEMLPKTQEIS